MKTRYQKGTDVGVLSKGSRPNFVVKGRYGTHVMSFNSIRGADSSLNDDGWSLKG